MLKKSGDFIWAVFNHCDPLTINYCKRNFFHSTWTFFFTLHLLILLHYFLTLLYFTVLKNHQKSLIFYQKFDFPFHLFLTFCQFLNSISKHEKWDFFGTFLNTVRQNQMQFFLQFSGLEMSDDNTKNSTVYAFLCGRQQSSFPWGPKGSNIF